MFEFDKFIKELNNKLDFNVKITKIYKNINPEQVPAKVVESFTNNTNNYISNMFSHLKLF